MARVPSGIGAGAITTGGERATADGGDTLDLLEESDALQLEHARRREIGGAGPTAADRQADKVTVGGEGGKIAEFWLRLVGGGLEPGGLHEAFSAGVGIGG